MSGEFLEVKLKSVNKIIYLLFSNMSEIVKMSNNCIQREYYFNIFDLNNKNMKNVKSFVNQISLLIYIFVHEFINLSNN